MHSPLVFRMSQHFTFHVVSITMLMVVVVVVMVVVVVVVMVRMMVRMMMMVVVVMVVVVMVVVVVVVVVVLHSIHMAPCTSKKKKLSKAQSSYNECSIYTFC